MKKNYYKLLDFLLDWQYKWEGKNPSRLSVQEKVDYAKSNGLTDAEVFQANQKLLEEGYIEEDPLRLSLPSTGHRITLEGYIFIDSGKYKQKNINKANRIFNEKATLERDAKRADQLVFWTKYLAIGTIGVTVGTIGLVVLEILTKWNELMHVILNRP